MGNRRRHRHKTNINKILFRLAKNLKKMQIIWNRIDRRKKKRFGMGLLILAIGFAGGSFVGSRIEAGQSKDTLKKVEKKNAKEVKELEKRYHNLKEARATAKENRPWNLMLVNQTNQLDENYVPELASVDEEHQVDKRIYEPLMQMLQDGEKAGCHFIVCSAYRSVKYQSGLFNTSMYDYMNQGMSPYQAAIKTAEATAWPTESEHASGLAVDIVSRDYTELDEKQAETKEMKWLAENCAKYGFILRYPEGKTDITGIIYESWHFRYIGKEHAEIIMKEGLCLEEYLDEYGL